MSVNGKYAAHLTALIKAYFVCNPWYGFWTPTDIVVAGGRGFQTIVK